MTIFVYAKKIKNIKKLSKMNKEYTLTKENLLNMTANKFAKRF